MSLKSALFDMKKAMENDRIGKSVDEFIHELEFQHELNAGTLVFYYNNLMMSLTRTEKANFDDSKKVNRKWAKDELQFMFQYIKERQDEGGLNITELLEEVAQLLNRGYQSVNYKYYSQMKENDRKKQSNQNSYNFTTITQTQIPVLSTEKIATAQAMPSPSMDDNETTGEDLLDILSGLISNVEKLPGINLNDMLKSLYQLTNMALQNQDAVRQFENVKSEIHHEKESLKKSLKQKDQQLLEEKRRNDELQLEVAKLAKEIMAFNQLGDAAKIQNLKSYNQRLNYIIDGSGVVLKVGS
ncbi:hypothetical protein ACWM35_00125 [Neobacillus sp. K501]